MRLAVGLDGAGWHPAAWREPGARPSELLTRLRELGVFRRGCEATTLRGLLGLTRPASRYTAARQGEPG